MAFFVGSACSWRSQNFQLGACQIESLVCCVTVSEDYHGATFSEIEKTVLHGFANLPTYFCNGCALISVRLMVRISIRAIFYGSTGGIFSEMDKYLFDDECRCLI